MTTGATPAKMGRVKVAAFNFLLAAIGILVAAIIGEAVLRLKNSSMKNYDIEMWRYARELKIRSNDPLLGHEHVKNGSALLQSVTIRTNELGLRGAGVPPPQANQRRILVLGASITLGWGVPEDETMTARLQQHFDRDGVSAIVMNGGIGNYNAERYVELFLTKLTDLQPTDLLVHYFVRDAEVLESGGGNWFLRNSELGLTLWQVWVRMTERVGQESLVDHYRTVYDPTAPGLAAMKSSLKRLADYAHANKINLYLAMMPDVHNLEHYQLGFAHQIVQQTAAQFGYTYLDLLPYFGRLPPKDIWAMSGDPHPNALGHQIMADAIFPMLVGREKP